MSYDTIFLIWRIAFGCLLLCIQYYLYRLFKREFFRTKPLSDYTLHIRLLFIAMNLPFLYLIIGAQTPIPKWLLVTMMYPFSIWQAATIFIFLLVFIWKILKSPYTCTKALLRFTQSARQYFHNRVELKKVNTSKVSIDSKVDSSSIPTRRKFIKGAVAGLSIYSFGGAAIGVFRHEDFEIERKTIRITHLPEKLRGTTIAMISDIHAGLYMTKNDMDEYVGVINKLKPDLILLPGDFVTNQTHEIIPVCESLQKFQAPYGIFGCLGNHDFFANENIIAHELQRAGITMLRDQHQVIEINNEKLAIIGVDDVRSKTPLTARLHTACNQLDRTLPSILLCHKPYYLDETIPFNIDFVLSGHTHGGQIVVVDVFDIAITPASLVSKYVKGLYSLGNSQMYVSRGIGTVGLPIRLNCPPEISLFTLTST